MVNENLVNEMTLEEKVSLCHACSRFSVASVPRVGIEELVMSDGPNGVREEQAEDEWRGLGRKEDECTYLPNMTTMASTWNPELCKKQGAVLGSEARFRGKDIILSPGINIIRNPLGGRNFEYMSEDPYLISQMVTPLIQGIQSQDVAACVKHYALNNEETNRGEVNVEVSKRALFEIYLKGFEAAVKDAGVYSVMGAYNCYNHQHCCHNAYLVNEILKDRWGFDGVFMSDWAGTKDTMEGACNGLDIEMGSERGDHRNDHMADAFLALLKQHPEMEALLDDKVRRSLRLHARIRKGDPNRNSGAYNTPEHQQATYDVASEGIVLLKNENVLPITGSPARILVAGPNADRKQSDGGGSSAIRAFYEVTPLEGIQNRFANSQIIYLADADRETLLAEAAKADCVFYIGGLHHIEGLDSENADKKDMKLPYGQDEEIAALLQVNPNTVIALISGSPVEMPWLNEAKALLWTGYLGTEGGNALADVLGGAVNPSGKLTYTLPRCMEDVPAVRYGGYSYENNRYLDDIFVGYRGYDRDNVEPLFCFGHGLSYSEMQYSDLVCAVSDGGVDITLKVKNLSKIPAKETVQIYVGYPEQISDRPPRELKAFHKVTLAAGEEKQVKLFVKKADLALFCESADSFVFSEGMYRIDAAASSRNIRLSQEIAVY